MLRRISILALAALAVGPAFGQETKTPTPFRVYFVGNSVTDTINYGALAELAKSRGHNHVWGRHMIPGAPLQWIWQHPKDGFQEPPFGHYPNALPDFQWDALSLQPFDRHLDGKDGDLAMAKNFIDLALAKSPDLQVYVYARWPRQGKDDFDTAWLKKYTGGWDGTNETKDYFERLTLELRKAYPKLKKPILMVPVGHVMYELNQQMKAGKVPGHKHIKEVYADGIHLNNVGSYIVGCTFFATLYRENPKGLPSAPYKVEDGKLAGVIQEAVWKVVSTQELAGVATFVPTNDPVAAIRAVLPKGWIISRVKENASLPNLPKANGKAIFMSLPQQQLGPMQSKESIVYIMPADYQDSGEESPQEQQYRPRLILTTSTAKIYLRGNETPFSSTGWHTLKDDILKAMSREPVYDIATKKSQDSIQFETKGDTTILTIASPSGIGRAAISPKEGQWPKKVVLRLRLKGLESLTISNGKVTLGASVSSHGDGGQRVFLKDGDQEKPVGKDDQYAMEIKMVGGEKVPLKEGYFEMELPKAVLKDAKTLTISWIDFYRG
jgi:hypothetical protein